MYPYITNRYSRCRIKFTRIQCFYGHTNYVGEEGKGPRGTFCQSYHIAFLDFSFWHATKQAMALGSSICVVRPWIPLPHKLNDPKYLMIMLPGMLDYWVESS